MIRSFRHKGLAALFEHDEASGVRADLIERCRTRLGALQHVQSLTAT